MSRPRPQESRISSTAARHPIHAGIVLYVWAATLLLIPSTLLFAPLGAAGTPAQILGLAAAAWWLGVQLNRSRRTPRPSIPTRAAMAAFGLAMLLSYVAAAHRPVEAVEVSSADRGMILVVSWIGLVLLTTDGLVSRDHLLKLLRFMVTCMALVGVLGVVQYLTHTSYVDKLEIPGLSAQQALGSVYDRNGFARTAGTATHPIEFGVVLTMMLPIALHFSFADVHRSRFARWAPVVCICAALPLTMSRSAFLGLAVVLAILLPSWKPERRVIAYAAIVAGLGFVYLTLPGMLGTMLRLFTGISDDDSARSRTDSYALAFDFIGQHPVFGRGISTFLPSYRILDNQYLGLLIETGVVGLVAFLALLVTTFLVALRLSRALQDPLDRSLARSLTATVASAGLGCATFDAFGFPQVSGMLFFTIGAVGALYRLGGFVPMESGSGTIRFELDFSNAKSVPSSPDQTLTTRADGPRRSRPANRRAPVSGVAAPTDSWEWKLPTPHIGSPWDNMVVLAAGVSWDDPWMSEKHLARALSTRVPVLYVDPPMSMLTRWRKPQLRSRRLTSALQFPLPCIARVTPISLPGVSRPVLRKVAIAMTRRTIRRAVSELGGSADAIVAASFDDVLNSCPSRLRVLWGTDDWVAGAALMGLPAQRLEQEEAQQLQTADVILSVSQTLADRWIASGHPVQVFPNGCDAQAFTSTAAQQVADDITLPQPLAIFVGHISERIDIDMLNAVAEAGVTLLLVGPLALTSSLSGFEALTARPNVQWTGPRPFSDLPRYLAAASVGLTPYAQSEFNRGSYPLKTIEYLAAGLEVVSTDLPAARALPSGLIHIGSTPREFALLAEQLISKTTSEGLEARQGFARVNSWEARASQLLMLLEHPAVGSPEG